MWKNKENGRWRMAYWATDQGWLKVDWLVSPNEFAYFAKELVWSFESHLYLTDVTGNKLRRHLSNMILTFD